MSILSRALPYRQPRLSHLDAEGARRRTTRRFPLRSHSSSRRSAEHTSELQSLMRISYAGFCLKKKTTNTHHTNTHTSQQHPSYTCTYFNTIQTRKPTHTH